MGRVIWVQTAKLFLIGGGTISLLLNVHGVNDVRQIEIQKAEPLMPEPSAFEFEMAIEELKDTHHQVAFRSQQN